MFGRQLEQKEGSRGPPGVGFKVTADGQFNVDDKRLCNITDPKEPKDAVNLDTVQRLIKSATDKLRKDLDELDTQVDLHRDDLDKEILIIKSEIRDIKSKKKKKIPQSKDTSGQSLKDGASTSSGRVTQASSPQLSPSKV